MTTRVTSKGQVTIPAKVRARLGIVAGTAVAFEMTDDGRVVLVKAEGGPTDSRFAAVRGSADAGLSTDAIMALMRGEP